MKTHVLLVEDDEILRGALEATLCRAGYDVTSLENGAQALEHVSSHPVDVVVTDLIMPEQEGIETIVKLRRLKPELPIIAMSGGGASEPMDYLRIARGLGAKATLTKPFHPDLLLAAVARHAGHARGTPEDGT